MRSYPMDWITDSIAIGNFVDAENPDPKIDFILCLKPECNVERSDIETVHIPLIDGSGNSSHHYRDAVRKLARAVVAGKKVLVHCHAGRSRSATIVAKYLMESMGISSDEALAVISQKREICLTRGIEEAFQDSGSGRTHRPE
ncbi:MAG: hypothetical protein C0404_02880 [Verrucomicrobia bacterium]|nr:hypothetical protein [Verrucomicrobiota bacterium]